MLGKVVLTKVDADAPGTVLPGAVFKLEEQAADGSWSKCRDTSRLSPMAAA